MWARLHGPTWVVAVLTYGGWLAATYAHRWVPLPILAAIGGFLIAWQGSLQHETIHGHPAGPKWLPRALGSPPLALWLPYELYRDSHRRHHATANLTHPEHDPESSFVRRDDWQRMPPWLRTLVAMQATALGRMLVGPFLTIARFLKHECAAVVAREPGRRRIWALHLVAVSLVLAWVLAVSGMPLWKYLLAFVYPGTGLTLLRSLAEHRADPIPARRTTVVEAGWLFRLLYLNNNFHVTHHRAPHVPWFQLPALWRGERERVLRDGSHVVYGEGYLSIVRAHAIQPIANLGMYDGGDLTAANDELWTRIAERLRARGMIGVPSSLERHRPLDAIWSGPLLFGQTCGHPFASRLSEKMKVVGVPVYEQPGCEGIQHRSFIVVRASSELRRPLDLLGRRAIINDPESNTGRNLFGDALVAAGARYPFFATVTISGSHLASLTAVADGAADAAAIDCVTYAHSLRANPRLGNVTRILLETRLSPSLPFITSRENDADALLAAAREALADPRTQASRRALGLVGIEAIDARAYGLTRQLAVHADMVFGPKGYDL
ncbi:fatty acid desaturase [Pendulispora albinea]|uniref:Fatty acid desaturase n=1 Tax=Pendulispora albinea TaxID=2741071 RepID=A0ABZ2LTE6_9BACT